MTRFLWLCWFGLVLLPCAASGDEKIRDAIGKRAIGLLPAEEPARKSIALGVISKQGQRRDVTLPLVIELVPE